LIINPEQFLSRGFDPSLFDKRQHGILPALFFISRGWAGFGFHIL
jgi:hypothetical protein